MALGIQDSDLERLLLTRRLRSAASAWPLSALLRLGAIGVVATTPAAVTRPVPFAIWAATAIALGLATGWLTRAATKPPVDLSRLQASAAVTERVGFAEALWWAAGLGWAAWVGPAGAMGTIVAAGAAAMLGPLLYHRGHLQGERLRAALLATALSAGAALGEGAASVPYLLLIAFLAASVWLELGRRERIFAGDVRRDFARNRADHRILDLLNQHESQGFDWSWTVDADGRLRDVSPGFAEAFGTIATDLEGAEFASLFEPGQEREALAGALAEGSEFRELPLRLAGDGAGPLMMLSGHRAALADGPRRGTGRVAALHEPAAGRVARMALVDPLTALANRHALLGRLRDMLGGAADRDRPAALFVVDIDDFQSVNDTHGPKVGDALLREFAMRIRGDARAADMVARIGGNRFAVAIETVGGDSLLIGRAHRLLAIAREPFGLHGATIRLSTSVGLARSEAHMTAAELLRRAELALHSAKAKGRDRMVLYEESLDRGARDRRLLESELRDALSRKELVVHYQPVIALATGETVAFEALVRWNHPTRGPLMPDSFLPVAEESGLILTLGAWVIRRALEDVARWEGSFRLAINLSPSQTRDPRLASIIETALAITAFPPSRLEFEITEHVLLEDADRGRRTLERLRGLGVQIALDDFGTGYSSLSYLRSFRFDRVKIDRVFVGDIEHSDEARAIVSIITRLAQALDMQTTAEGVEDPRQLDMLRKLGCDEAQGFLIHRPVDAGKIAAAREAGEAFPDASARLADYREARRAAAPRLSPRSL